MKTERVRIMPTWDTSGHEVLDIGCHDGFCLTLLEARSRHGIDVDPRAIKRGILEHPHLSLRVGYAEDLPYPNESMDTVFSKVSLPYTDIPKALREIQRVLKPGGQVLLTMHDWRLQWGWLWIAIKGGHFKRVLDHAHVIASSAAFNLLGWCPPKPWNGRRETFQTQRAMRREIRKAGLDLVRLERTPYEFVICARRAVT